MEIRLLSILHDTTVDGPGLRTSVYCAGCAHQCLGCHNPQSWPFDAGRPTPIKDILDEILSDPFADVTFTGGDPFYQAEAFAALARLIHAHSQKTIWCYTGFHYEQILAHPTLKALLQETDVLVDGPFVASLKDESLVFRGSSNQRIIDVRESLLQETIIPHDLHIFSPFMKISSQKV